MKQVLLTAALVIALASMSSAQKSATENVTLNAKVIQGLILGSISGPLNFGNANNIIVKGAVATSDTVINVASDARAVNFTVTGDGGQSATITYPATATLNGTPSGTMTFTPTTQWTTSTTQSGGTSFASGASIGLGGSLYSSATKYIWMGGSLASPSTAAPGSYTGTIVVTVSYTNQ